MSQRQYNHFFILGAAKSGTTSLHDYLNQHPKICMSDPKEPFYFELTREFKKGLSFYREKYFNHCSAERWLGDARHRNLYLPWVPKRIKKSFESPKFIIILREPVERAFSHYWHWKRQGKESLSFTEAIYQDYKRIKQGKQHKTEEEKEAYQAKLGADGKGIYRTYLDSGYYYEQIKRYQDLFPPGDILIFLSEEFFSKPREVCNRIFKFLGLGSLSSLDLTVQNRGYRLRSRLLTKFISYLGSWGISNITPKPLKEEIIKINRAPKPSLREVDSLSLLWLYDHFDKKNQTLSNYIGLDLQAWKEKRNKLLNLESSKTFIKFPSN